MVKATDPKTRIPRILKVLDKQHPKANCTLDHKSPLELLVATILSAQCTDALVNKVTPDLFKKYKTAKDYAKAPLPQLEKNISKVNFYRNKAKSIQGAAQVMVDDFGGKVPGTMDELITLPGVARKTANVILGNAFGVAAGVVVDTHVMRLSQRMGLSSQKDRDKIEQDLMALVPKNRWTRFGHEMILHGRTICKAKAPLCEDCGIGKALCPSFQER